MSAADLAAAGRCAALMVQSVSPGSMLWRAPALPASSRPRSAARVVDASPALEGGTGATRAAPTAPGPAVASGRSTGGGPDVGRRPPSQIGNGTDAAGAEVAGALVTCCAVVGPAGVLREAWPTVATVVTAAGRGARLLPIDVRASAGCAIR